MANVEYASKVEGQTFWTISEGTYFDYNGSLYLLVSEDDGLVFDFEDDVIFNWYNNFDSTTIVHPISPDRIDIKVN